jgi:hypothetical protein
VQLGAHEEGRKQQNHNRGSRKKQKEQLGTVDEDKSLSDWA